MPEEVIYEILQKYELKPKQLFPVQKGYRNESHPVELGNGKHINLIIYKAETDILNKIKSANLVSDYLANQGFPTRSLLDPRIIKLKINSTDKYCAVYSYLPGQTIPWEAYTMKHIKLLGATLSNMHYDLAKFKPAIELPNVSAIYANLTKRIKKYLNDPKIKQAMLDKLGLEVDTDSLNSLYESLELAFLMPSPQVLHLDYVRGNILFDKNSDNQLFVSGVLDFEKTAVGNKIFDLARTLAFLLIDCKYKSEDKIRKYFLISGYNKKGKSKFTKKLAIINGRKVDIFEELINFYLVYDIYKFMLHNPYESLSINEHYKRTLELLLDRCRVLRISTLSSLS